MQPMTLQEVFDNALFGIRAQGYKRSIAGGGCAYDSAAGHCGIGHSFAKAGIDGALLDRVLLNTSIASLLGKPGFDATASEEAAQAADAELSKVAILFHGLDVEDLLRLQTVHDDHLFDEYPEGNLFETRMERFAHDRGLTYTPA